MDILTVELRAAGRVEAEAGTAKLIQGPRGEPGAVYVPAVTDGVLSWSNDAGLENPAPADIRGPRGEKGDEGARGPQGSAGPAGTVYVPSVDGQGNISWSNDGGLANPQTVNIRGPKGDTGAAGPAGAQGTPGADGGYYSPGVDSAGNLSWTPSKSGMAAVAGANIKGPKGDAGDTGPMGPAGPKGDTGSGLDILGQYASVAELQASVTQPQLGDNYYVGVTAPYNIYTWTAADGVPQWVDGGKLQGARGEPGPAGGYYTPAVDGLGNLSWTASGEDMPAVQGANIRGPQGAAGAVFTPGVDSDGELSWTNDGGLTNPAAVNIRGPKGDDGATGAAGAPGEDGGYYTPEVNGDTGALSWTASRAGMPGVPGANIKGPKGDTGASGADGGYYTPGVDSAGNLSWTPSKDGMEDVPGANIKGPKGDDGLPGAAATVNGVSVLNIVAGENVDIGQSGSTLTISAAGANALVISITDNAGVLSADKTNAQIWAAYQAGTPMYAIWDGYVLMPAVIEETSAYFTYTMNVSNGSLLIEESGGQTVVYAESGAMTASSVSFNPGGTGLTATNVQAAIVELMEYLGLT